MNEKQRAALLIELHREIEASADSLASTLAAKRSPSEPTYPPNGGLTGPEEAALASLALTEHGMSAVRKLAADAIATTVFGFLNLLDGTADPVAYGDFWPGFEIEERGEEDESTEMFLHDAFYECYWAWREKRTDPGWKLDILDD